MDHREIFQAVRDWIATEVGARAFSLVDLGCGDARFIAAALKGMPVERYVGYDLSAVALAEARTHLAVLGCPVELRLGDMLAALHGEERSFDIVFSSFAVHHLETPDKAAFFRLVERHLNPGGWLALVDVMREEGEDRQTYLARYLDRVRTQWSQLSTEQIEAVCGHISDRDFPETPSHLTRIAAGVGLRAVCELPAHGDHHTLIWQRPAD